MQDAFLEVYTNIDEEFFMPIEPLLKSDEVQKKQKIVKIDYSNLDPSLIEQKEKSEREVSLLIEEAHERAKNIIRHAEEESRSMLERAEHEAEQLMSSKTGSLENMEKTIQDELENKKKEFNEEIQKLKEEFEIEKERELKKIEDSRVEIKQEIINNIWETTKQEAMEETKKTYERLINQVHAILNEIIKRRSAILADTQEDMAKLIMLIARKVVKVFTERDDSIVIKNIVEAMAKLKGREKFVIRINAKQLAFVNEHIDNIKKLLEENVNILVLEDTRVDEGGCIIETEFGNIDARIATQLAEIEAKVRDAGLIKDVSF